MVGEQCQFFVLVHVAFERTLVNVHWYVPTLCGLCAVLAAVCGVFGACLRQGMRCAVFLGPVFDRGCAVLVT